MCIRDRFNIVQGTISTIMNAAGFGTPQQTTLPAEMVTTIEAVSYTHLDVYKRQGYGLTLNEGKGFANPTMRNSIVSDLVSMMEVISSSMV